MALASNILKSKLAAGAVNLATADIRSMLLTSAHTPDADHDFVSSLTNEVTGTGYARKTLANKALTEDDTNGLVKLTADDRVWTGADFGSPEWEVFYVHVTDDTDSWVVGYAQIRDSGASAITTNGGDLTTTQHATNGLLRVA